MRLFILSLLAIGSVNSHAIGDPGAYAYRTGLFAYNPARGQFPVQDGLAQGYVRYIDGSGTQRLIAYNYPEPLYGVRRLSVSNEETTNPLLRSALSTGIIGGGEQQQQYLLQDSAREAQFRAWCEQRYQALKSEIDQLRTEGKIPSADLIAQVEPLEKLLKGSNYMSAAVTSETPEVKRAREEHLRIWNEARLRVLQLEAEQMRLQGKEPFAGGELKTGAGSSIELNAPIIGETAEQLRAREEHLRLYNEQALRVQQLETQGKPAIDFANRIDADQRPISETGLKSEIRFSATGEVLETPEVMRAREEHLRLFNEAKLRAEKEGYKYETEQETAAVKLPTEQSVQTTLSSSTKTVISSESSPIQYQTGAQIITQQQPLPVQETPEVLRAREEHLKLHNEVKLRAQAEGYKYEEPALLTVEARPFQESLQQLNAGLKSVAGFDAPIATQQPAQIQDTPEVVRAREEHLRLKAQLEDGATTQPILAVRTSIEETQPQPISVQETPEVIRAREEHLKLLNEAKLKAQAQGTYNPNDDGSYKPEIAEPIAVLRMVPAIQQPVQPEPTQITETPEVIRAREEHLRLVNEAKLQATQQQQVTTEIPAGIFLRGDFLSTSYSDDSAERQRETERLREEEKMRAAERLRDVAYLKEEERLMVAERLRLQQQEEQRMELERLAEAKRLKEEQKYNEPQLQTSTSIIGQIRTDTQPLALPYAQQSASLYAQPANIISVQRNENPFFVRFAGEKPSYLINQRPLTQNTAAYYLPVSAMKQPNPFFVRYTQEARPELPKERIEAIISPAILKTENLKAPINNEKISNIDSNLGQLSTSMKINYGEGAGLSELEKATREHFRAHEIALEQLRLANFQNPNYKDC